jgi:hypothetical protein
MVPLRSGALGVIRDAAPRPNRACHCSCVGSAESPRTRTVLGDATRTRGGQVIQEASQNMHRFARGQGIVHMRMDAARRYGGGSTVQV